MRRFRPRPPAPAPEEVSRRDVAVIDVGSNSVRLVQFRLEGRALWPVFNEKVMAGLGRGARQSGELNPEGVETALRALRRFAHLLDAKGVEDRHVTATAAVRDCADGPGFIARVQADTGLEIEVLSGEEEGRRSALGVLAGIGEGHGLAGDLGGSSLELTPVEGRRAGPAVTLPLGPLAMLNGSISEPSLKEAIDAALASAAPQLELSGPTFYAVGGAWRALAHLAMALDDYPLVLLHQYALTPAQVARAADFAITQSEASLAAVPGVSSKRAALLPYAALLMRRILKKGRFDKVVFSAFGLREGVVCARDLRLITEGDPLLAGAEALASQASPEPDFGPALAEWIEPAFAGEPVLFGPERDRVLRGACARLADLGGRMHPDHRAELASTQTLYAPFGGVNHAERGFLALAMHHRYAGRKLRDETCPSRRLLDESQETGAMKLGLALRLGAALSGRSAPVLEAFRLDRSGQELVLRVDPGSEGLVIERARTRFDALAGALGLQPQVI
ncbi:Ppx/GppA family phosphatase [Alkalicaulis satelles]|uniref:Ppx/GppA family phosphatase n=1 Tax=Alkalicaulis satelles TaxID=2609175 RepID=A0A5M6ZJR4_9PROT|nr:Ppx/GppA phosphatase family protein [Alkalicaulis satelles]KAA5804580.1 Ppx/GppA family phosphatase [Alkalicaulis satelles]